MKEKTKKIDGVIEITTGDLEDDIRYLENLMVEIPKLHPEAQKWASKYLSLRLKLENSHALIMFKNIIEIMEGMYKKNKYIPKLTEEEKQEVIRINNLNIPAFRKAEMMFVQIKQWQRYKTAAGISRPRNKKMT